MGKTYTGNLVGADLGFAIVQSRFNDFIAGKLTDGAKDCLIRHGVNEEKIDLVLVPGSFEIPLAAKASAESGKYHGIICLGALVRGGTIHFDLIAAEVTKGIAQVSRDTGVPVTFGVITTENLEQAIERAGTKAGNKGAEAAAAAIEMANLLASLK